MISHSYEFGIISNCCKRAVAVQLRLRAEERIVPRFPAFFSGNFILFCLDKNFLLGDDYSLRSELHCE